MNTKYKSALILASSFYLSEEYPNNVDQLTEDEIAEFVRENSWEPLELDIGGTMDQIDCLANTFIKIDKNGLNNINE